MPRDDVTTRDPDNGEADELDQAENAGAGGQSAESGEPEAPPATVAGRRWPRRVLVGLLIAGFLAAGSALGYTLYQQSELHRLHQDAVAVSRDYLVHMASFDYEDLEANKEAITAASTPDFARRYDDMVAALRDIVVTSKGVATATADHVAVQRLDTESAVVLGFVDQQVTNVTAPEGNTQRYRMVVTLTRSGDRWIVDDVETV
ncbi:MAG: mce associated protein mas1a [Actinomycetota bacterium]|nr:mce associated protein mas1a [Actinomycetota bacterium]